MFKLLRYFSIASLVACSATTFVLWNFSREKSFNQLIESGESRNSALAQVLANGLQHHYASFLKENTSFSDEALKHNSEISELSESISKSLEEKSIAKVKIFDLNGRIIFSTDPQQIGKKPKQSKGFMQARAGEIFTEIDNQDLLAALKHNTDSQYLLSSYIPIRQEQKNQKVEGVFEVYSDLTPAIQQSERDQRDILSLLIAAFGLLYGVLFVIVYRGNKILENQMNEIETQISARQLVEVALQQKMEQLARSNAELEQFAYVASHDLQEPLRKIETFGDRLKTKCSKDLSDRGVEYIDRMQNAAGRMRILIQDLLEFSRVSSKSQPFDPVNLQEIVSGVLSDLETRIEETQSSVIVGHLPTLEADALQMRQLFQNLIGNALKFRRSEEPLRIEINSKSLKIVQNNGKNKDVELCQITVADNGIGFEQKYTDRIFRVFQRLHSRSDYDGTGIGLAVCAKIAERHGGTITAEGILGQGATFIVTLPFQQSEVGNPT